MSLRAIVKLTALPAVLAAAAALVGAAPAAAESPGRDPVVFVHGLFGSPANFDTMSLRLRLRGYTAAELVTFSYNSTGSLTTAANALATRVQQVLADAGAERVDLVTHSLGGLPSRWYVKFLGGTDVVDDWISLGGPNLGGAPGSCPAPGSVACDQATQGSEFITTLNAGDPTPAPVSYTTFSSRCDTVVDDEWTIVDGANNVDVGCVSHVNLVSDRGVFDRVHQAVSQ